MAAITVGAKVSVVNIIADMTIYTTAGAFVIFIEWPEVTAIAVQSIMRPPDFEIGLIMIKLPDQPIVWVMASLAIIAQRFFMNIIILMTIVTA